MRKVILALLAVLVLLLVGVVVADRVVHARTEARLEAQVADLVETDGEPDVTIHGVPFLTQLLADEFGRVTLEADGMRHEELRVRGVRAEARDVGAGAPYVADRVTATATVPVAVVQERVEAAGLGVPADITAEGQVLRLTTEAWGPELSLSARPLAVDGGLHLAVEEVSLAGRSVALEELGLGEVGTVPVPLDGLPEALEVSAVEVVDDGVRVELTGQDVALGELAG